MNVYEGFGVVIAILILLLFAVGAIIIIGFAVYYVASAISDTIYHYRLRRWLTKNREENER